MVPTHLKMNWGRGVSPGIPFMVPFSLLWGRLENWNWGPPSPLPLMVSLKKPPASHLGRVPAAESGAPGRAETCPEF